jgi:integrase
VALSLPPERSGDAPIQMTVTLGDVLRFSLRTDSKSLRDLRHAAIMQQLETAYAAILKAHEEGPSHLTNKQCHELSGIIYRAFADGLEDIDTEPQLWAHVQAENDFAINGPLPGLSIAHTAEEQARIERLGMLDRRFGPFVDAILLREGVICINDSRNRLLFAFSRALSLATDKLKRNAGGDYTPDPAAASFPAWKGNEVRAAPKSSRLSFDNLLDRWKRENKRAASSIVSFTHHVADFKAHLGHNDVLRVTRHDVVAWKDKLLERGLSAKTINGSYLASISALYNLAKRDGLVEKNPTEGVRIPVKRDARDPMDYTYTDAEVATLLALAERELLSHLRWVPWLAALTGARVSEIVQLWGKHIEEEDGIRFLNITPTDDGGTLKTGSSKRKVPLHPALLQSGFLEFVATRNGGPLFYGRDEANPRRRKSETASHASKGPANRVREWIRANGFTDPLKAPNHAFRYWFKFKCGELDIPDSVANAIQGHTDGSIATRYRGISLAKKAEAMAKITVPTRT